MEIEKRFGDDEWTSIQNLKGVFQKIIIGPDICKSSNVRLVKIEPKIKTPPHEHPQLQVFFVLQGKGSLIIENKEFPISKDSRIIIKPNLVHFIKNTMDTPLICLIFDEYDKCFESFSPYVDF